MKVRQLQWCVTKWANCSNSVWHFRTSHGSSNHSNIPNQQEANVFSIGRADTDFCKGWQDDLQNSPTLRFRKSQQHNNLSKDSIHRQKNNYFKVMGLGANTEPPQRGTVHVLIIPKNSPLIPLHAKTHQSFAWKSTAMKEWKALLNLKLAQTTFNNSSTIDMITGELYKIQWLTRASKKMMALRTEHQCSVR